jgi:hypothetical protein
MQLESNRVRVELVNLTPHDLDIFDDDVVVARIPRTAPAARIVERHTASDHIVVQGVSIPTRAVWVTNVVTGLPPHRDGTLLVVSRAVAHALPDRTDLRFPVDAVRDATERVVGCRKLGQFQSQ